MTMRLKAIAGLAALAVAAWLPASGQSAIADAPAANIVPIAATNPRPAAGPSGEWCARSTIRTRETGGS